MSLKRPMTLFAVLFIFSSFCCAMSLSFIAFVFAAASAVVAVLAAVKNRRLAAFVLLACAAICIYSPLYSSISLNNVRNKLSHGYTEGKFEAVTYDVSVNGSYGTIYARLCGEHDGLKVALPVEITKPLPTMFEELSFHGRLKPIIGGRLENGIFSRDKSFIGNGYFVTAEVYDYEVLGVVPPEKQSFRQRYYFFIYDALVKSMPQIGKTDTLPYALALLTGDRTRFSAEIYNGFAGSGLTPFLCISGLHIVIAGAFLKRLLNLLRVPRFASFFANIAFLVIIAIATGAQGSILRASVMHALFLLDDISERHSDPYSVWAFSFCAISLFNPFCFYDIGTLLSFLCMLGILAVGYLSSGVYNSSAKSLLFPSFYAFGFSSPVINSCFGRVYLLSPFSNLAASLIFSPLMFFLVPLALLAFLPDSLFKLLCYPSAVLIGLFEAISAFFAAIPFSYSDSPPHFFINLACACLMLSHLLAICFGARRVHVASAFACAAFFISTIFSSHVLAVLL